MMPRTVPRVPLPGQTVASERLARRGHPRAAASAVALGRLPIGPLRLQALVFIGDRAVLGEHRANLLLEAGDLAVLAGLDRALQCGAKLGGAIGGLRPAFQAACISSSSGAPGASSGVGGGSGRNAPSTASHDPPTISSSM